MIGLVNKKTKKLVQFGSLDESIRFLEECENPDEWVGEELLHCCRCKRKTPHKEIRLPLAKYHECLECGKAR